MRSKNVLIVAHHYPPHISGVGVIAQNHAERLAASGMNVTVVTSDTDPEEKSFLKNGVNVVRIKAMNTSETRWQAPFPIFSPSLLPALWRATKRADIVHIHDSFYISSFFAAWIAHLQKKPIILTQHIALIAHPRKFVVAIEKLAYSTIGAAVFTWSDTILTYNSHVEKFLINRGVSKDKLFTLVNGVDTQLFYPAAPTEKNLLRSTFGLDPKKKTVLFVGRFVPKKGYDKLIGAKSTSYQIVLAGGDPLYPNDEEVIFLGKLPKEHLSKLYRASDLFVLPSENEGFPLSIQEAMASGLPIVTTDDPGYAPYNLDRSLVLLLDQPTATSIQHAITSLIDDPESLKDMAQYSRNYACENFSWPSVMAKLEGFYEQTIIKKIPKKKIAIVSDVVYPFNKGGKEKRIYDVATRFAAQGYETTVYCMKWWDGKKVISRDGVTLYAISPYFPLYTKGRRSITEAVGFAFFSLRLLWIDFDSIEVDHMPYLVLFPMKLVCLIRRKRMVVTWHEVVGKEYWKKYLGNFRGLIAYAIERISVTIPDVIISVSNHTTNGLRSVLNARQEIITIPNGLDIEKIEQVEPSHDTSDILFAGRLLSHKNVDVLLRAIAIIKKHNPTISLSVIGDGPEKSKLEALTKQLDIQKNVRFHGFLESDHELYSLMRASKVFVMPSSREGFGIAIIEANAAGLPVITVDEEHNAAKELVTKNENGIVCLLNEKEIAETISATLKKRKMPEYYKKYAEQYSWNQLMPLLKKIYLQPYG
jgi:D-inositol-3-phosphate glycosyltransferase